jgi:hypothetical protein
VAVLVRIGSERTAEEFYLGALLVQIDRLARPAVRRSLLAAVHDTYGAAVPARRARVLRALLAEARADEAHGRRRAAQAELAVWVSVARPG